MKKIILILLTLVLLLPVLALAEAKIPYSFLSAEECAEAIGGLETFYSDMSQKTIDFGMQEKGHTAAEYMEYTQAQALDYTEDGKAAIDRAVAAIKARLDEAGLQLPENVTVSFALTTMNEFRGAGAYTHGTTVFMGQAFMQQLQVDTEAANLYLQEVVAHELFHCLTRNNPEFRRAMYGVIGFTVTDQDFEFSEDLRAQIISNPDVGHHDSYAAFTINGEKKNCCLVLLSDNEFEKAGDSFFRYMYAGLVDIDDGTVYRQSEASDFTDVMGKNTDYCIDPEECLADNFAYSVVYGESGPNGKGYATPEIIEKILALMKAGF